MRETDQVRRTSYGRPFSPTRLRILELLEVQSTPTTLSAIVKNCGLHENTVRTHLEDLLRDGYLIRHRAEAAGRGRPAWMWEAKRSAGVSPYAGLASALATVLHKTSKDPVGDATEAGLEWGRELAAQQAGAASNRLTPEAGRAMVVELFQDAGFSPQPDEKNEHVTLTRCPLLEAASKHPGIVCGVHLGIIRGALDEMGLDGGKSALQPFSGPGECSLQLRATEKTEHQ